MSYYPDPMPDTPPQSPYESPLHQHHLDLDAYFLPYGADGDFAQVVETLGDLDMEYAALRKGCIIFDQPHVGTIRVSGEDRGSYLNNMITNKVDDLAAGKSIRAFWLNRKGRVDADLRLAQRDSDMLIAVDRHICNATADTLAEFVFAEDAQVVNANDAYHRIAIHGPSAAKLIEHASDEATGCVTELDEYTSTHVNIAGAQVFVEREDLTGEIGLELCIPREHVLEVFHALLKASQDHPELKAREGGWLAMNAARIEAGHPLFNIDFGETNLPVESGIIETRINFNKGCYLGQEVVARMHARGACARKIVAIKVEDEQITVENQEIHQPTGGSQLFEPGKEGQTPVGEVTSSTISPMLGAVPICFAMLKDAFTKPGMKLKVSAEGKLVDCTVQESLVFWKKPNAHG